MQTILGGGGAFGTLLAKELGKYTNSVRIVGRNPKKVNSTDELKSANLLLKEDVYEAVKGSEVAFLTVGLPYNTKTWQRQWPVVMRNVIDACKAHSCKLVFLDNIYMYDQLFIGNMSEETPVNPVSKKGKVRAQIAQMLLDEVNSGALTALIARSADFYGPGVNNSLITHRIIKRLQDGRSASWIGSSTKAHNFTFVPDAARATALLGNSPKAFNQVWHLPTDRTLLTGKDWVALFAKEMRCKYKVKSLPPYLLRLAGIFNPILREFVDISYLYTRNYFFDSRKFDLAFDFNTTDPEIAIFQTLFSEDRYEDQ